jgi:hypothetical protein
MTLLPHGQRTQQQQSISAAQQRARNARGAIIPTSWRNKALLFATIGTIYQISPPARKVTLMPTDKTTDSRAGAPAAKKPAEGQRFDLFRTFRHPPKPAEPFRAPRNADKPKG